MICMHRFYANLIKTHDSDLIKTHDSESQGQEEAAVRDERVSYLHIAPL